MKYGLVLEGGAMRGMFTAGVLDVFMEHGLAFDGAVGVSAGATFGCNYKSRQIGRAIRYNKKWGRDPRYCSVWSFLFTGDLYGAKFCYETLPFELDLFDVETYRQNPMRFYVTVSNAETGTAEYHEIPNGDREDLLWMRASASMPIVSRPVEIDGKHLLDGGMTASIPLKFMQDEGYEKNVVILTQPRDYVKKPTHLKSAIRLTLRKFPNLAQAMLERHTVYNAEKEFVFAAEKAGAALVIAPETKLPVQRTENSPQKLETTYQIGRAAGLAYLERVQAFLGNGASGARNAE